VIGAAPASPPDALATVIWQLARFVAEVPHIPVPTVPVTTLNGVDGKVPAALTVTGVAPVTAQPAELVAVVRHSTMKTESLGVNPVPVTVTACPFFSPVLGVTVSDGGVVDATVKVMGPLATGVPVSVPTTIAHFASADEVPHVPLPTVPVTTVKDVDGKVPSAFTVIRTGELVEQPVVVVAVAMHSTAANDAPAVNPDPVRMTFWPFVSPVLGVTVSDGPTVKVMGPLATGVPVSVPTTIAHIASADEVPHVPLPIVPVCT
jgi:hypothetical protein